MVTTMASDPHAPPPRVEVITSVQRRRRWTTEEKLRIVEKTHLPGNNTVSLVTHRQKIAGNRLLTWRRLIAQGAITVVADGRRRVGIVGMRHAEAVTPTVSSTLRSRPATSSAATTRSRRRAAGCGLRFALGIGYHPWLGEGAGGGCATPARGRRGSGGHGGFRHVLGDGVSDPSVA